MASIKVLWRNHKVEEDTWEDEEDMKSKYPFLFSTLRSCIRYVLFLTCMFSNLFKGKSKDIWEFDRASHNLFPLFRYE